jgi:NhaP-type Na+/H+ or K+/H+ antiporter
MSLALLILISALIGFVLGLLGPRIISHSREKRREQRQQQRAAEEAAPKSEAE